MESSFSLYGPWTWATIGILLCAAETIAPGVFLLWLGLAAIATGLLQFAFVLPLSGTLIAFALFALAFVYLGRRVYGSPEDTSDQPFLNQRIRALIGREVTVSEPIAHGEGHIQVDDALWKVKGPDCAIGTRVRITGQHDAMTLTIETL